MTMMVTNRCGWQQLLTSLAGDFSLPMMTMGLSRFLLL